VETKNIQTLTNQDVGPDRKHHMTVETQRPGKDKRAGRKEDAERVQPPSRQVDKMAYGIISSYLIRISWPCLGGL